MEEVVDIKSELRVMINQETDIQVLEAIRTLLVKTNDDEELRKTMTSRALKAEQDIAEGRTMNREEMEKRLNARLGL